MNQARSTAGPNVTARHAVDPFRWLEDGDSPATARWLDEQRRLCTAHGRQWTLTEAFTRWLDAFTSFDEFSPPRPRGARSFYTHRTGSTVSLLVDDGRDTRVLVRTGGPEAAGRSPGMPIWRRNW